MSTLPIRNGNIRANHPSFAGICRTVSTLPIRNGNKNIKLHSTFPPFSEYLTYKEWKLIGIIYRYVHQVSCVSTLPIRNGNQTGRFFHDARRFCEYLTYKEWKHFIRLYSCKHKSTTKVSTLPIRNGNNTSSPLDNSLTLVDSEYLTYKEWKQRKNILYI